MGLITWLVGAFASLLGHSVLRFIAWKTVITALLLTVFPIVMTNIFYKIMQNVINTSSVFVNSSGVSTSSGYVLHFTGVAAFLASNLYLPEVLAMILSAIGFRLGLYLLSFAFGRGLYP